MSLGLVCKAGNGFRLLVKRKGEKPIVSRRTQRERWLQKGSPETDQAKALLLVTLYNWANATETLARYMLEGEPGDPLGMLDKQFEAGIRAAAASGEVRHELVLQWLNAIAHIMVTNSRWWAKANRR